MCRLRPALPRTPLATLLACCLLAVSLSGCASTVPAVPLGPGSRVLVRLYDARTGIELALANQSHPGLQGLYSRARDNGALKLAPDQLTGELLASLDLEGLDRFGRDLLPGQEPGGSFLLVEHDARRRLFAQPGAGAPIEERQAWSRMKLVMDEYYQHVGGLQYVNNPKGAELFRKPR